MREIAGLLVGLLLALSNPSLAQNASFSASVNAGCSPLVVNFDASLSAGLGPLTYVWDFGNGNTTTGQNQQSPGAVYVNPGTYTVSLYVTDATGSSSAIVNQTLTVYANPQADFSLSDTLGCPPLTVNFNDLSSSLNNTLVSWTWDFGDGNAGAGQNPSHTYTSGTYPVSLIVEDANGCKGVATKPAAVSVYPRLQLDFSTPDPRRTCNNSLIVN
ncbi:MAG: PKD domain-containing protein, partial [Bacteroidota bacterium]